MYGALVGGTVGAIGGGISGYLDAKQRTKQTRHLRRRIQEGVNLGEVEGARSVGNILSSSEYLTGANWLRSFFGLGDAASEVAQKWRGEFGSGAHGSDALSNNLRAGGHRTFTGTDAQGAPLDALSLDFVKSLRAAQSARGLEPSMAAGAAEAAGLSSFRAQMQAQLLPQLMQLAEGPASLRAKYEAGHLGRNVFRMTGGAAMYGQANPELAFTPNTFSHAVQGAVSGFSAGSGIGGLLGGGGGGGGFGSAGWNQGPVNGGQGYGYR
jgi:hypothetical protein